MSTDPDSQKTFRRFSKTGFIHLFIIQYMYLCSKNRNILPIFLKFCTHIYFCNSLDKFGGQKNPLITFTPHFGVSPNDFAFWGLKKLFWKTFPEMGSKTVGQRACPNYVKPTEYLVKPSRDFLAHYVQ